MCAQAVLLALAASYPARGLALLPNNFGIRETNGRLANEIYGMYDDSRQPLIALMVRDDPCGGAARLYRYRATTWRFANPIVRLTAQFPPGENLPKQFDVEAPAESPRLDLLRHDMFPDLPRTVIEFGKYTSGGMYCTIYMSSDA
jgi:hypothetical protein